MIDPTVCVVGGGITGLSAAWELANTVPRVRVLLLEADTRLGGKLRTGEIGGRAVDLGPDAFLARREEALVLCEELGLGPELVSPGAEGAYVWARGRLRPLPAGLALGVPTRLGPLARSGVCTTAGLARVALDLLLPPLPCNKRLAHRAHAGAPDADRPDTGAPDAGTVAGAHENHDESVGSVVRRRLGRQVHDLLADPLVGGIHAGPIDTMSAASVFPQLLSANSQKGSLMRALRVPSGSVPQENRGPVFATLRGGLERLVERLAAALGERGVEIRLGETVERVDRSPGPPGPARWAIATSRTSLEADGVVVAVPAGAGSEILRELDAPLADLLGSVTYASVTLVTLRFPRGAVGSRLDGTGFLVPACEGRLLTACTWLSSKWPEIDRPDDVLLRASMGRYGDDRSSHMTDQEVVAQTLAELRQMLDLSGEPLEVLVTRWPTSFPQYLVGHLQRVGALETEVGGHRGLGLAGAALHGVGIPACVGSGRRAARDVLDALAPRSEATP